MRSAIRGDFERLAERRGEQELMRVLDEEPEPERAASDEPPAGDEHAPEQDVEQEVESRRSWLARLLSP